MWRRVAAASSATVGCVATLACVTQCSGKDISDTDAMHDYTLALHDRTKKALYSRFPNRIILVRHGESEANETHNAILATKPDPRVELTAKGVAQARAAGKEIKEIVGDEGCCFIVSPFTRTLQTCANIISSGGFSPEQSFVREEPRLREQEFGMLQDKDQMRLCRAEKAKIGSFFYRWPRGESGCDVYDRVSGAIETLHRHFKRHHSYPLDNVVIVSHGLTNRLFLMRWFHWTTDEFEGLWNQDNASFFVMEKQANGKYKLVDEGGRAAELVCGWNGFACPHESCATYALPVQRR